MTESKSITLTVTITYDFSGDVDVVSMRAHPHIPGENDFLLSEVLGSEKIPLERRRYFKPEPKVMFGRIFSWAFRLMYPLPSPSNRPDSTSPASPDRETR